MDNTAILIAIGSSILLSSAIPHIVIAAPRIAQRFSRRRQRFLIAADAPGASQVDRQRR